MIVCLDKNKIDRYCTCFLTADEPIYLHLIDSLIHSFIQKKLAINLQVVLERGHPAFLTE